MKISRRKFICGASAVGLAAGTGAIVTPMIKRDGEMIETTSRAKFVAGTPGPLPEQADVVIIGGGIIGAFTAANLKEMQPNLNVVILEKGVVAGEQSGRAYGQVISYELPKSLFEVHHYGQMFWRKMNERTGLETSYRTTGRVACIDSKEHLEKAQAWIEQAKKWAEPTGVPLSTRIVQGEELKQLLKGTTTDFQYAAYEQDAGAVDPEVASPAIAEYAKKLGVKIYTQCAVRGIETTGGKVSHVVTEKGTIRTNHVVAAAGYWSRLFMGNLGVDIPTLGVYLTQSRMNGLPTMPNVNVHMPFGEIGVHFRPQADGSYAVAPRVFIESITRNSFEMAARFFPLLIEGAELPLRFKLGADLWRSFGIPTSWKLNEPSPFEKWRTIAATPSIQALDQEVRLTRDAFPAFEKSNVIEKWGAVVPVTDDELPILTEVPQYPGLILNIPVGWGMTESPVTGRLAAEMVLGKTPFLDVTPYRLDRFADL